MNVITICKILPLLDKETFLEFSHIIFHVCLVTVHADMMKKFDRDTLKVEPVLNLSTNKNLNVRQSDRKRLLSSNDNLNQTDVHLLFVQSVNVIIIY